MATIKHLLNNYILVVAAGSWFCAQVIKVLLNLFVKKKFVAERLIGSGGMPSSHSAAVCSMTIGIARLEGVGTPLFALSFMLAAIVMYDAMGVRRAAGEQAKVINKMVLNTIDKEETDNENSDGKKDTFKELKEYLGHTPLEVLGGALLGIIIAMIVPVYR